MINKLVESSLKHRVLILIGAALLIVWGIVAFFQLPIEAYPDVMNTQVQVITQWPGHAAEEVEKLITVPLETSLNGTPRVQSLRSRSLFGLSVVYLTFQDGVDDYFARQQVLERVGQANLPANVQPGLQPLASATGEILRYTLIGAPLMELREIQDWTLDRELKSVPGVADVNPFGGLVKQYQVLVDPDKLKSYDVTLQQVETAISGANGNSGGSYLERGSEENVIRGIGLIGSTADLEDIIIGVRDGTPLTVGNVAQVHVGHQTRLGKVGLVDLRPGMPNQGIDQDDVVMGIVLLRRGEDPNPVLADLHKKIDELNTRVLPKGVRIVPLIDRTDLVKTTSRTVEHNLLEGMLLVVAILFLFLGNVRAAIITAITIPVSLLFAFSVMNVIHVPANLISLGAIDFGLIVNGSVILVENVYRRLAQCRPGEDRRHAVLGACREVQSEILFTTAIIISAYLPLFTMQSVEKKMFTPMAYTISLALIGSLLMALVVAPVLCFLFLKGHLREWEPAPLVWIRRFYRRTLAWTLDNPILTLGVTAALFAASLVLAPAIGTEFLPHLDEGNLWIRASMPDTISYTEAARFVPKIRQILAKYQPVKLVESQLGRPDDGTDATGFYNAEFLVDLKPYRDWRGFRSKDQLVAKMAAELDAIPGVSFNFSQNIEDNVEEAVTGVKGELAVKLFGEDLDVLEKKAAEIQGVMGKIPGVVDLATFRETGEPQLQIVANRRKMARYGLNIQDVQDVVETAIGGKTLTQKLEGEKKFDIVARLDRSARGNVEAIRHLQVSAPDNARIPLEQVTDIRLTRGASFIYREANHRFIAIKFGVRGRDLGGAVEEARRKVAAQVRLKPGYYTVWGGEFESMQRAQARLNVVLPATLLLMFLILFTLSNSFSRAFVVIQNVPLALIGGIFALYLTHFHLSVSAAVGFIALFGVSVQNGVIMTSHFDHLRAEGYPLRDAIVEGAETRLRPVLMTALLAMIGLIPAAISTGIGSDTQKPIAIVIIGGLLVETVLTLYSLPIRYELFCRKRLNEGGELPEATPQHI